MDHFITADKTKDVEIVTSWLNWTMSLSQLFNNHDNEELTAIINDIRHHVNGDFNASRLLAKLDLKQKQFLADHWRFSSPAAMIAVALLIAVLSFIVWRKCCAQTSAPTALSPTPAVAYAIQAPQVPQVQQPTVPQLALLAPTPSAPLYANPQQPMFKFQNPAAPVLIYT